MFLWPRLRCAALLPLWAFFRGQRAARGVFLLSPAVAKQPVVATVRLKERGAAGETFQEAALIGRVLGKYELGVSDGWVALRAEELVRAGTLRVVSEAPADEPVYRRTLQKCAAL